MPFLVDGHENEYSVSMAYGNIPISFFSRAPIWERACPADVPSRDVDQFMRCCVTRAASAWGLIPFRGVECRPWVLRSAGTAKPGVLMDSDACCMPCPWVVTVKMVA